ncbi:MAG: MFS transporter [Acidimicrobiales bacterium]|nr:MFS transporter [Acidimicrobiales bacterium]
MTVTAPPASADTPDHEAYRAWAQRRVLRALVIAQVFGGAGLAAGVSVGALLAKDLLGSTTSAGLPAALFTAGSAGAALTVGRVSQRHGRRIGLTAGYAAGAVGGAGVVLAAVTENVPLLLLALLVYGAGTATNLQCRYAGADLAEGSRRGRAISTVLVATTLGAVAGPNLLQLTGDLAESIDLPRLSGPFMLASAVYATAGIVVALLLRPDPLLTARALAGSGGDIPAAASATAGEAPRDPAPADAVAWWARNGPLVLAASGMVLAQAVMVAVMTMTPVHLEDHQHGLDAVGLIIGLHIGAMYLPSPLTGRLVDRFSPAAMTAAGGAVLATAALTAAAAGPSATTLAIALVLLGLGWNLSLVGGTTLVTNLTTLENRARTQGSVDLAVALAGAAGGLSSGAVVATASFEALGFLTAGLAALIVFGVARARQQVIATT